MITALIIIGWLVCSVVAYFVMKIDARQHYEDQGYDHAFTVSDRLWALFLSVLVPPLAIVVFGASILLRWARIDWDAPAKW